MRYLFVCLLTCYAFSTLGQQDKIVFKKYGVAEGLPEEYARWIIQDDQGFMWIATQNGLVKFDGYEMKTYRQSPEENKLKLKSTTGGLLKSRSGKIYLASFTDIGIASYDPTTAKFDYYTHQENDTTKLSFKGASLLFEDLNNNIWYTSYNLDMDITILCKLNPESRQILTFPVKFNFGKVNDIFMNAGNSRVKN